jgi:hypothetical protein
VYDDAHKGSQLGLALWSLMEKRAWRAGAKESGVRKHWKMLVIAAVVAALGLSVVAVAYGATKSGNNKRARTFAGACAQLFNDPQAVADMQALRVEHQGEMQDWWTKYGSNPADAEAQAALKKLRTEHWNDMKALFKKYGVKLPANAGPRSLGGYGVMGGGGCGGAGCGAGGVGCGQGGSAGTGYGAMGGYGMMGGSTY